MTGSPRKPLVAFSYDIFAAQIAGGVSRCMIELMRSLSEIAVEWRGWAGAHANKMLLEAAEADWMAQRMAAFAGPHRGRIGGSLAKEWKFARWARGIDVRMVHRTYYPLLDMVDRRIKRVETLHDMWDERSSSARDRGAPLRSQVKRRAIEHADLVVCVSNHTREDLLSTWPWAEPKLTVIPHGVRKLARNPIAPRIDRPYFLFVGRRGLYKNFHVALEGLRRTELRDHLLICFGGGGFTSEEQQQIQDAALTGRVAQLEGGDSHLAGLYEGAVALVYPSSFEGFGLPLLEAMIHDCPVISSPLTSLPEVGGDAVLYGLPNSPDEWAQRMMELAMSQDLATRLRKAGRARASTFDWQGVAEAHMNVYQSL